MEHCIAHLPRDCDRRDGCGQRGEALVDYPTSPASPSPDPVGRHPHRTRAAAQLNAVNLEAGRQSIRDRVRGATSTSPCPARPGRFSQITARSALSASALHRPAIWPGVRRAVVPSHTIAVRICNGMKPRPDIGRDSEKARGAGRGSGGPRAEQGAKPALRGKRLDVGPGTSTRRPCSPRCGRSTGSSEEVFGPLHRFRW